MVIAIAILAMVGSLITIASRTTAPYYSVFSNIPPMTYVEYVFVVSITDFLPGFLCLSALNAKRKLGFLGMVIFSYVLSFFISSSLASVLLIGGFGLSQSFVCLGGISAALSAAALLSLRSADRCFWQIAVEDGVLSFGFLPVFVGSL